MNFECESGSRQIILPICGRMCVCVCARISASMLCCGYLCVCVCSPCQNIVKQRLIVFPINLYASNLSCTGALWVCVCGYVCVG